MRVGISKLGIKSIPYPGKTLLDDERLFVASFPLFFWLFEILSYFYPMSPLILSSLAPRIPILLSFTTHNQNPTHSPLILHCFFFCRTFSSTKETFYYFFFCLLTYFTSFILNNWKFLTLMCLFLWVVISWLQGCLVFD